MSLYPNRMVMCVPMSFEANEQLTVAIPFNSRVQITQVKGIVVKALAASDAGTITIKNHGGTTLDTLSYVLSAALEVVDTSVFASDVYVAEGETLKLVSAKTTAGGKLNVFVEYQCVPGT